MVVCVLNICHCCSAKKRIVDLLKGNDFHSALALWNMVREEWPADPAFTCLTAVKIENDGDESFNGDDNDKENSLSAEKMLQSAKLVFFGRYIARFS